MKTPKQKIRTKDEFRGLILEGLEEGPKITAHIVSDVKFDGSTEAKAFMRALRALQAERKISGCSRADLGYCALWQLTNRKEIEESPNKKRTKQWTENR